MTKEPASLGSLGRLGPRSRRTVLRNLCSGAVLSLAALSQPVSGAGSSRSSRRSYQATQLPNPDPNDEDAFGRSLSISHDGSTAVIGAHQENRDARHVGTAYVFEQQQGGWDSPTSVSLPNPDPEEDDVYGSGVTVSGTGSTVAVSAINEQLQPGTNGRGAVYVFEKQNGAWESDGPVAIPNPQPEAFNSFGADVDMNTEGTRLLVGAPSFDDSAYEDDDTGRDRGRVYLFTQTSGRRGWESPIVFQNPEPDPNDSFGWDISLSGDGSTVLVGAAEAPSGDLTHVGEAYVFSSENDTWKTDTATALPHPEPQKLDYFGRDVTVSHNGRQALVGAPLRDTDGGSGSGKAYIFRRTGEGWATTTPTMFPNPRPGTGDHFGDAVSFARGGSLALIGAPGDSTSHEDAGTIYVYERDSNTWSLVTDVTLENEQETVGLGNNAVFDGSGATILGGPVRQGSSAYHLSGEAYVFSR